MMRVHRKLLAFGDTPRVFAAPRGTFFVGPLPTTTSASVIQCPYTVKLSIGRRILSRCITVYGHCKLMGYGEDDEARPGGTQRDAEPRRRKAAPGSRGGAGSAGDEPVAANRRCHFCLRRCALEAGSKSQGEVTGERPGRARGSDAAVLAAGGGGPARVPAVSRVRLSWQGRAETEGVGRRPRAPLGARPLARPAVRLALRRARLEVPELRCEASRRVTRRLVFGAKRAGVSPWGTGSSDAPTATPQ